MIRLRIKGEVFELDSERILIGRSQDCNIRLDDRQASRRHAVIEKTKDGFLIMDLDSKNGTFLNGKRIGREYVRKADQITIGETKITVEYVSIEPAPDTKAETVPFEDKIQLKRKIQSVRRHLRRRTTSPLNALVTVALILVSLILIYIIVSNVPQPQPTEKTAKKLEQPPQEPEDIKLKQVAEALKKDMQRFKKIAEKGFVDDKTILDFLETVRKYEQYPQLYEELIKLNELLCAVQQKQLLHILNICEQYKSRIDKALSQKKFYAAYRAIIEFEKKYGEHSEFEKYITSLADYVDSEAEIQLSEMDTRCNNLLRIANFADAIKVCQKYLTMFDDKKGTCKLHLGRIQMRIQSIKLEEVTYNRLMAIRKEKAELLAKRLAEEAKRRRLRQLPDEIATALARRINRRVIRGTFEFTDEIEGTPISADSRGVKVRDRHKIHEVLWSDIYPETISQMLKKLILKGQLYYKLAVYYCYNNLKDEAEKALYNFYIKYAKSRKKEKQKADELVAKMRGIEKVPEGGFFYEQIKIDGRKEIFIFTYAERENFLALQSVAKKSKSLARASTLRSLERRFKEIYKKYYTKPGITQDTRIKMQKFIKDGLLSAKERVLQKIKKRAIKTTGFSRLIEIYKELQEARKKALEKIYDEKFYPHGPKPQPNQDKIEELVNDVKEIWQNKASVVLPRKVLENVKILNKITTEFLAKIGVVKKETYDEEIELIMNNLNDKINIRNFCPNASARNLWKYNRKVEEYNKNFKLPPGVPETCRQQLKILNDYREMMGRRRLILCAKLCKAAQYHTEQCKAAGRIWHNGPDGTPGSRAKDQGHSPAVGENVAMGYQNAHSVHWGGWFKSAGHHRNMLSDMWTCAGVGNASDFWTQVFGRCQLPR
jgi:pSer/pThr/pTyr-binding forkhead associated (FHA) protein